MAIPSGSGTEVLKKVSLHGINNAAGQFLYGVTNHIFTILTIFFNNQTAVAGDIEITVYDGVTSQDIRFVRSLAVGPNASFVWNDRFAIFGGDVLKIHNEHTSGDWYCTYIDQDWT